MVAASCAKSVLGAVRSVSIPSSLAAPAIAVPVHAAGLARRAPFAARPAGPARLRCRLCVRAASANGATPNGPGLMIDLRGATEVLQGHWHAGLCPPSASVLEKQQQV